MRLRRRAPSTPCATPVAAAQLPLRAQALVPFAVALALVVALAAVGAALIARQAVDRELRAQADTARSLVASELSRAGQRAAAETQEMRTQIGGASGRVLQDRLMAFAQRERLTLAATVGPEGRVVGDGRLAWVSLPYARSLLERARRDGRPVYGTARSRQDEPLVLAAAWLGSGRGVVAGWAIDRGALAQVERPTGVLVHLETEPGAALTTAAGTRSFVTPLRLSDGVVTRLQVSVASDALRAATFSSLLLVSGLGVMIVAGLMLVLSVLLRRSVVRPVAMLRAAMARLENGDYATRVDPAGAAELHALAAGFNDMAHLVEAQRDSLQALAESDPLTGVANHRRFHQALDGMVGDARSAAVVVLDLDHFKFLNDTRGHPYGDQVLREVAARLREAVRGAHDLVGRLGGEEFGLLLCNVDADEAFRETAQLHVSGVSRAQAARLDAALRAAGLRASGP